MKKALSLVLALLLLLSLCACGSDDAKNTEPATTTCSHAWKDATCTAPKTCAKCGATEGSAAGHTYAEGACTVCKTPDPNVYFTDNTWTAQIVRPGDAETGEVLSMYSLMATAFQGYAHKDYYANANYEGEPFDQITYNGKTYYDFWFSSNMDGIEWEDKGDTVTVTFPYQDPVRELVLTRSGEAEFTVTASNDEATIPVGIVFRHMPRED